jgi:hypothetical protein
MRFRIVSEPLLSASLAVGAFLSGALLSGALALGLLESGSHAESESRLVRDGAKRSIVALTLPEILLASDDVAKSGKGNREGAAFPLPHSHVLLSFAALRYELKQFPLQQRA